MADPLRSELVVSALQMAQPQRQPGQGLLVHSDRGVQYARHETRTFLEQHGWLASRSRSGNPYDNAWLESALGKIKNEVLGRSVPADPAAAKQQLFVGIECWYNQRRRHSALRYQSPVAFETQFMKNQPHQMTSSPGHRFGGTSILPRDVISRKLSVPNAERIFFIRHALRAGFTIEEIFGLTKIDRCPSGRGRRPWAGWRR